MHLLRWNALLVYGARCVGLGCVLLTGCRSSSHPLSSSQGLTADEASIRRLDAAWVKAAESKQVDAWMAFYADDAVVLPPNDKVAESKSAIRKSVGDLLALPGLSLTWKPTKIEVAGAGDLAYMYGTYEMSGYDAHGMPMTDYGKNVEIWKKQTNGGWKCIVDTWNSDLPVVPLALDDGKTPG